MQHMLIPAFVVVKQTHVLKLVEPQAIKVMAGVMVPIIMKAVDMIVVTAVHQLV